MLYKNYSSLLWCIITSSLFLVVAAQNVSAITINVDGNLSDWADVPFSVMDPQNDVSNAGRDITRLRITNDTNNLYVTGYCNGCGHCDRHC